MSGARRTGRCRVEGLISLLVAVVALAPSLMVNAQQDPSMEERGTVLNGGIVTRTDVKEYADLALDLRDIRVLAKQGQAEKMAGLYLQGEHAFLNNMRYPLKQLSDELANAFDQQYSSSGTTSEEKFMTTVSPFFLFHLYGLSDGSTDTDELRSHIHYASNYIQEKMAATVSGTGLQRYSMVADSIIVLGMWMYGTQILYDRGIASCQRRTRADNPSVFEINGGGMDEFIALWIGTDQTPGTIDGHSLYRWAQEIGRYYSTNQARGEQGPEVPVNSKLKLLYQQGATVLSLNDACTKENPESVQQLWNIVTQMTNTMMIPLYQWFIYHWAKQNPEAVALYAHALIPQLAMCRPSIYQRLKETVLDSPTIDFSKTNQVLHDLHETYECFSLTCRDIGVLFNKPLDNADETIPEPILICDDGNAPPRLADYIPSSDVTALSRIDLDIYQLTILMELEGSSSSSSFAYDWYMYGRNVPVVRDSENDPFQLLSLQQLAVSSKRSVANPYYTNFVAYFNDKDYANTAMTNTILHRSSNNDASNNKWTTPRQRARKVQLTAAYQIVLLEAIVELRQAVDICTAIDPDAPRFPDTGYGPNNDLRNPIDKVAALIIGSMEDSLSTSKSSSYSLSGLEDGQLIWNLANRRAFQFQRMVTETTSDGGNSGGGGEGSSQSFAIANSEILDLLFAAKAELAAADCDRLDQTNHKIQQLMMVGIIQSIIRAAMINEKSIPSNANQVEEYMLSLVEGETLTSSFLPFVASQDPSSTEFLQENMVYRPGLQTVRDGAPAVGDTLGFVVSYHLPGLYCHELGMTAEVDPCRLYSDIVAPDQDESSAATASTVLATTTVWILVLLSTTTVLLSLL